MTRIAGFLKVRNEIARGGNIYRALANLEAFCDGGIICDDASTDGTDRVVWEWAQAQNAKVDRIVTPSGDVHARIWTVMHTAPAEQDFARELEVKQRMLDALRVKNPEWVWWGDGDETLDEKGTRELRAWIESLGGSRFSWKFHYTQLWRNASWARTDDGFDDGYFLKLWRYSPDLTFDLRGGTHRQQFPVQLDYHKAGIAPFEVIHWGNASSKALVWKGIQYSGGLGGVDRHIAFGHSPAESLATGKGYDEAKWSKPYPTYRQVDPETLPAPVPGESRAFDPSPPKPFSLDEIKRIRAMGNLRDLKGWFTVVIPAFNRAKDLPRTLNSLLAQRYEKWVALVVDDGSTDDTAEVMRVYEEMDPRIFYARQLTNRGGVAANEIGMSCAVEWTEFWSRLGSDDWWGPGKLETDALALEHHDAIFGPFQVWRHGLPAEVCAGAWGPAQGLPPSERLKRGQFLASWANVAVKTSVLRKVRERFGNFCDPSLRNMEDFLVNVRIAHVAEWAWRAGDPNDAAWTCLEGIGAPATASASANAEITGRDHALTLKLISEIERTDT